MDSEICGRLHDMSVREVLKLLCLSRRTGTLHLSDGSESGRVDFHRGTILRAYTSSQFSNLGEVLVRIGIVTPGQIDEALRQQRSASERLPLGRLLIQFGSATPQDVASAMRIQVEEVIQRMIDWRSGEYWFEIGSTPVEMEITQDVMDILLEVNLSIQARLLDDPGDPGRSGTRPGKRGESGAPTRTPGGSGNLRLLEGRSAAERKEDDALSPAGPSIRLAYVADRTTPGTLATALSRWKASLTRMTFGEARDNLRGLTGDDRPSILIIDLSERLRGRRSDRIEAAVRLRAKNPETAAVVVHAGLSPQQRKGLVEAGIRDFIDIGAGSSPALVESTARDAGEALGRVIQKMVLGYVAEGPMGGSPRSRGENGGLDNEDLSVRIGTVSGRDNVYKNSRGR